MKITNETKIGILAAIAIVILILGFNFLKGKNLLDKDKKVYAVFSKVDGLTLSNPVMINGLQVGTVYKMQEKDRNLSGVVVTINLNKDIDIPKNSMASISQSILGTASLAISLGNNNDYVNDGDTLLSRNVVGLMDQVQASINPTLDNVNGTLLSLDSLLETVGGYFDPATKNNFQKVVANLTASSASLQNLLNDRTGALAQSLNNVNSITGNLSKNNDKINNTMSNLEKATGKFANAKIDETLTSLQKTVDELKSTVQKVNSTDGSLGLLINDNKLYNNLQNTTRSLNILLDDVKVHPKRYINVSVFGRKDRSTPLTAPLAETDSLSANVFNK
jgi:phospholipid/cholesterol/gamma-HCH transport system substrate-binding protein